MKQKLSCRILAQLSSERAALACGTKRHPVLSDRQQRGAFRALVIFFALMLIFTVISRASAGATMARVTTASAQGGTLALTYYVTGTLEEADSADLSGKLVFSAQAEQEIAQNLFEGAECMLTLEKDGTSTALAAWITSVSTGGQDGTAEITAAVEDAGVEDGTPAVLTVTGESQRYSNIVPISALRNVDGKDVVFVVRDVENVIGLEQRVVAVEVNVLKTTPESAAVEGAIAQTDRIISYSNKPIAEGDRVRVET